MTNQRPVLDARDVERAILALACTQHGVVARTQLLAAGISPDRVDRRVRGERLRPIQRGVYLVGPLMMPLACEMSAVLAGGASAVVSHRSAGRLWRLLPASDGPEAGRGTRPPSDAGRGAALPHARELTSACTADAFGVMRVVDVTIPPGDRRRRPGVRFHRTTLHADEVTRIEGLPVTTPPRTLYDLASLMREQELERAVAEALALRLTTEARLDAAVKRYAGRAGANRLAAVLGGRPARTRSTAEASFLALIDQAELPRPEVNVRVCGHEVDFYWRAERLVTEMDGFAFHGSRGRFERDRRRDARLAAAGVRVMRVTWRQLEREPHALLVRLAQALARGTRE